MGAPELLALSLGLSIVVAALGGVGGRVVEGLSADPRLRDRVWGAALILPALPPLAVASLLLTPPTVRDVPIVPADTTPSLIPTPAEIAASTPAPAFSFDPVLTAWVILAIAFLLTAGRLAALALRARRLARIVREAEAADPAVAAMVESAARDLNIRAPRVGVSATTTEALLACLGRARLILPVGLTGGADAVAAEAVIAHELAHLRRGDHRALWLEEALLALLAVNPLMPLLRARRAAAREEACDALALSGAAPETRRAYARSLIEALRDRAGPQVSGDLPALTFTGAGRTTTMHRLKAVLNPVAPAGRRDRLSATVAGCILLGVATGGSVAVAAQREPTTRFVEASDGVSTTDMERTGRPAPQAEERSLPARSTRVSLRIQYPENYQARAGDQLEVRFVRRLGEAVHRRVVSFDLSPNVPLDEVSAELDPIYFTEGHSPDLVAQLVARDGEILSRQAAQPRPMLVRGDRGEAFGWLVFEGAVSAPRQEPENRYRRVSAARYQSLCASRDPGDQGLCAGVMFAQLENAPGNGFCPPASLEQGDEAARRAALGALVARGKAEIARGPVRAGDTASSLALTALVRAYPCGTGRAEAAAPDVVVEMPVELALGGANIGPGDEVRVALADRSGILAQTFARGSDRRRARTVSIPLTADQFPGLGEGNRSYTLTGEVRDSQGVIRHVANPVIVRLGPGSRGSAGDMRTTLYFSPA
ncbi:M56 family metallopeptidase [Brevundimonas sp.]|uniref:M56 family metallopeptidase n=1 Tax=Brevundimonas sp. TaxID=1871086 RepID=UPI002BF3FD0A|nr:M56 family metallopeptidase [Brevundimonas sp.]HWQ86769.1 M56 family metallopeptidase [Brevundimonas sp.]